MAQYDLTIKAVDQTKATMNSIEKSLANLGQMANKIQGVFAAMIGGLSVGKIIQTSAEFQNLEVRLKAVSKAGTDTTALLKELTAAGAGTTTGVAQMVEAYAQLKLAGLDASKETIASLKNLAGASGNELGRTAEIIGKAFRGEFGKLDDFGIDVQNRYGQFVIKYQGQTQAIVSTTGQVVNEIIKLSNTNAAFADAAAAKAKTIDAALGKLKGTIEGGIGSSELGTSIANIINKLNEFLMTSNSVTKAANYLATAINFVGDNVEHLWKMFALGGAAIIYFTKIVPILEGIVAASVAASLALTGMSGALANLAVSLGLVAIKMFRLLGWVGIATVIVGGVNLMIKAFTGFDILDWVGDKFTMLYDKAKKFLGLTKEVPNPTDMRLAAGTQVTPLNAPITPSGPAGGGESANRFLADIIGNLSKAKSEMKSLGPVLASALSLGKLDLAAKLFSELASRAEQFGIVLAKPVALIGREFRIAVEQAAQANAQFAVQLSMADLSVQKFNNEITDTTLKLTEQENRLKNAAQQQQVYNNEVRQGELVIQDTNARLANRTLQEGLLSNQLETTRQKYHQQGEQLKLLNERYAAGRLGLQDYTDQVSQMDQRYLKVGDTMRMVMGQVQDEVNVNNTRAKALREIATQYQIGALTLDQYSLAYSKLADQYSNTPLDVVVNQANRTVSKIQELKNQARSLDTALSNNTITWKTYGEAVKTIGEEYFPNFVANTERAMTMAELLDKTLETGMKRAGDALTTNLVTAINTGKGLLSSFKGFFNTILNDIAAAIVRKQFVIPITTSLNGAMGGGGGGGFLSNIFGNLFGGGGGAFNGVPGMDAAGGFAGVFAKGGSIGAGQWGIAGEKGAEVITGPATVTPMAKLDSGTGDPIVVNLSLNAIDTRSGIEFLVQNRAVVTGIVQDAFTRRAQRGLI